MERCTIRKVDAQKEPARLITRRQKTLRDEMKRVVVDNDKSGDDMTKDGDDDDANANDENKDTDEIANDDNDDMVEDNKDSSEYKEQSENDARTKLEEAREGWYDKLIYRCN